MDIDLSQIRREYGPGSLKEEGLLESPLLQFAHWFSDANQALCEEVNAMVLSTMDAHGWPNARVVLLKGLEAGRFIFYSNYLSQKGLEMAANPHVALTFYWAKLARQVRVRGEVSRIAAEHSDAYFASRPLLSQLSALVSMQSETLASKAELSQRFEDLQQQYPAGTLVPRPLHWGGYAVQPFEIEFWQGCDNRMHDRIRYTLRDKHWQHCRLAP
jgi:pyridoxamine 5'-phosphate oxidase